MIFFFFYIPFSTNLQCCNGVAEPHPLQDEILHRECPAYLQGGWGVPVCLEVGYITSLSQIFSLHHLSCCVSLS